MVIISEVYDGDGESTTPMEKEEKVTRSKKRRKKGNDKRILLNEEDVVKTWLASAAQLDRKIKVLSEWLSDLDKEAAECDHAEQMIILPLSIRLNGVIEFLRESRNGNEPTGASLREVMSFLNIKDMRQRLEKQWGE